MSFIRIGRSQSNMRRKKVSRKKPAWDDSIQDLTVHKATAEDIAYRKASHRSKNMPGVKLQRHRYSSGKSNDLNLSNLERKQMAIIKEVLHDKQQLQNVLSKTDQMMAVVKDLFGDDPKRYEGFPNVTSAPDADRGGHIMAKNLLAPVPDIKTRIEALSDSVMSTSALNDFGRNLESDSDDELTDKPEPIVYQPKLNIARFQQFLAQEERNHTLSTISGQAHLSHNELGPIQSTRLQETTTAQGGNSFETPKRTHNESIPSLRTPNSAMNDTQKIKKTKSCVNRPSVNTSSSAFNVTDLRKVLENLEDEIADYERETGRKPPAERNRQENFSGYTLSLVDSVTKLTRYLKECEIRLKAETTVREHLSEDVTQLKTIVDALTTDIIIAQEEYCKLNSQFDKYKLRTEDEIKNLKAYIIETQGFQKYNVTEHANVSTPPRIPNIPTNIRQEMAVNGSINQTTNAVPEHMKSSASAFLLSPPVQKTRVGETQSMQLERQTSLTDIATLSDIRNNPNSHLNTSNIPASRNHPPVATVNVPRPVSLVQSNVGVMLNTVESQNPTAYQPSTGKFIDPSQPVEPSAQLQSDQPVIKRAALASQIAELHQQHEDAQKRIQLLLQQQLQQQQEQQHLHQQYLLEEQQREQRQAVHNQQLNIQQRLTKAHENNALTLTNSLGSVIPCSENSNGQHAVINNSQNQPSVSQTIRESVSPPISPISLRSENFIKLPTTLAQNQMFAEKMLSSASSQSITVSIPRMDFDASGRSTPSPPLVTVGK